MRREGIVKSICKILTDIGNVYEWRVTPPEINELPLIVVRDREDNIDSEEISDSSKHTLNIEIEYLDAKKDLTAQTVREKLNAILEKIKENGEAIPADYLSIKSAEIELEQREFIVGRGIIEINAIYYTEKWGI